MQRIESKKGVAIRLEDDGTFTLEAGSSVSASLGKSASPAVKALRAELVGPDGKTTADHNFASLSALASFVRGAQTNGKAFFADDLKGTATPATAKPAPAKAPKASKPAEETATATEEEPKPEGGKLTSQQMAYANAVAQKVKTFCKDFEFDPDPRLINSLRHCGTAEEAGVMVVDSMELIGMPEEILQRAAPKFQSAEWRGIFADMRKCPTSHGKINQRLAIYYGPAGTGKTTKAIADNPDADRIIASPTQDPSELFTRNVVNEHGGVDLVLTELGKAMVDGKPIIIDELNLYQSCVLTRLQGVTDGGEKLVDNGREIVIKDGFKIIATMNLETNYGKTPLPNPLVSRAGEIVKLDNPFLGWVF